MKNANSTVYVVLYFPVAAKGLPISVWRLCPNEVQALLQEDGKVG